MLGSNIILCTYVIVLFTFTSTDSTLLERGAMEGHIPGYTSCQITQTGTVFLTKLLVFTKKFNVVT